MQAMSSLFQITAKVKLLLIILQLHFNAHVREYRGLDLVYDDTVQVYYHIKEKVVICFQ